MRSTWERKEKKNVPPNAEEIPLGWVDLTIYKNISDVCCKACKATSPGLFTL